MPQIFMTYDELAQTFGGDATSARNGAIECGLSRFKGSDGITQVGLSAAMTAEFLQRIAQRASADADATAQVAALAELASVMRHAIGFHPERAKTAA